MEIKSTLKRGLHSDVGQMREKREKQLSKLGYAWNIVPEAQMEVWIKTPILLRDPTVRQNVVPELGL